MSFRRKTSLLSAVLLVPLILSSFFFASDAKASKLEGEILDGYQYAWGENVGWINFRATGGDIWVKDYTLTGYAWGENIGWIKLNPSYGGVTNDGEGNLGGYAWGENVGWISFNPTGGGVRIGKEGSFSGYAWGENIGWISFSGTITGGGTYKLNTDWRPISERQVALPAPAPTVPTVPTAPTAPAVPTAPTAPAVPTAPTAPAVPTAPTGGGGGPIIILPQGGGLQTVFIGEQVTVRQTASSPAPIIPSSPEPAPQPTQPQQNYVVRPIEIGNNSVILSISSEGQTFKISVSLRETKEFDFNNDGINDVSIYLENINQMAEAGTPTGQETPTEKLKKEARLVFNKIAEGSTGSEIIVIKEKSAGATAEEIHIEDTVEMLTVSKYKGDNAEGSPITEDEAPTFKGVTSIKNADVFFRVSSKFVAGTTKADANGYWSWKVTEPLEAGTHSIRITAQDQTNALKTTTSSQNFEVMTPSEKSGLVKAVTVIPAEKIMPGVDAVKGANALNERIRGILPEGAAKFYDENINKKIIGPAAKIYQQQIIENETVQVINQEVAAPVITVSVVTNTVTSVPAAASAAVPAFNYLLQLLKLLFTEPAYLLIRKRKKWGVVYNSLTKQPIGLATIRLLEIDGQGNRKIISTKVTGPDGRYIFVVEPGKKYALEVIKPDYSYPSKLLGHMSHDGTYEEIYYGEAIATAAGADSSGQISQGGAVSQPTATQQPMTGAGESQSTAGTAMTGGEIRLEKPFISFNIPIDSAEGKVTASNFNQKVKTTVTNFQQLLGLSSEKKQKDYQKIVRQAAMRKASKALAYVGPIITLVSWILSPGIYIFILLSAHIVFLVFFKKVATKRSPKPWGEIFNLDKPKEKLGKAIIRVFDSHYGRLLLTAVTSSDGRYGFLVGNEKYVVTCEKPNYVLPEEKVEIMGNKEEGLVQKNIGLKPVTKESIKKQE